MTLAVGGFDISGVTTVLGNTFSGYFVSTDLVREGFENSWNGGSGVEDGGGVQSSGFSTMAFDGGGGTGLAQTHQTAKLFL